MKPAFDRFLLTQTFIRIVEAGSLSAAAVQMNTTQPTVSRRLQALERSLGVRLLRRSTHSMTLTEDGQRCLERARELLANWHAFEADLRGAGDEPEGTLRVVAPHAFGQQQLIAPLAEYLARYPRVNVDWLLHDRRPDFIAEGIDCAIQVGSVDDPLLVAVKLGEVDRVAVAAPGLLAGRETPTHPRQLGDLPWLALRTYYRSEILLANAAAGTSFTLPIKPCFSTDSLYALCNAALRGLGVCVASRWLVEDHIVAGRLVYLLPDWCAAPLPVHLVYPHSRIYPARLSRFVEWMRQVAPAAIRP